VPLVHVENTAGIRGSYVTEWRYCGCEMLVEYGPPPRPKLRLVR
jgi:hypothetical protein